MPKKKSSKSSATTLTPDPRGNTLKLAAKRNTIG